MQPWDDTASFTGDSPWTWTPEPARQPLSHGARRTFVAGLVVSGVAIATLTKIGGWRLVHEACPPASTGPAAAEVCMDMPQKLSACVQTPRVHAHAHARAPTNTHTHIHTRVRARARVHTYTHTRACTHTRTRTRAHTHTHTRAHTHARAHTHTRTRTHTHTHTHNAALPGLPDFPACSPPRCAPRAGPHAPSNVLAAYQTESVGRDGYVHAFQKPWFFVLVMFVGEGKEGHAKAQGQCDIPWCRTRRGSGVAARAGQVCRPSTRVGV
jgi:hypothetical protein